MKTAALLSLSALLCLSPSGERLKTRYEAELAYRVTRVSKASLETTHMSFERDGEPVEGFGRGTPGPTESSKTVVTLDRVLAVEEGRPTRVRRSFETLQGEFTRFGQEQTLEAPLRGCVLLLREEEPEEIEVELEEGSVDDDALLEGHHLSLALDRLLPEGALEPGASWELEDPVRFMEALGLDLDDKLFAVPELDPGQGRAGRGGGRRGAGGGGVEVLLDGDDWDVTLTLTEETEELDGEECLVIRIDAERKATLADRVRGGRREFSFGPGHHPAALETEVEIELTGRLFFSKKSQAPLRFEIEGELVESDNEFTRGESSMRVRRSQQGTFEQTVVIEVE